MTPPGLLAKAGIGIEEGCGSAYVSDFGFYDLEFTVAVAEDGDEQEDCGEGRGGIQ